MEPVPELLNLDNDSLKDLLKSDDKLDAFIETLPEVSSILNRCDQLAEENFTMAKRNLSIKRNLEKCRDLTLTKLQNLKALQASYDKLGLEHQHLVEKFAPSNLQEMCLLAAARSDEESETFAERFLAANQNPVDVNAFIATYMAKRVESHLRRFKGERLGTQLMELQKAGF